MSKVLVLQHARCETIGIIRNALESNGISAETVHTFEDLPVPRKMEEAEGLIVMGGPMGVYEQARHPFLADEMRLIERALAEDKPILGVCLGSQLLAAALGAPVTKGKRMEIGWYPITLEKTTAKDPLWAGVEHSFVAFHWHRDVFDLPRGATSLASSELTACQAFRYGRGAYGFLFHMETTEEILRDMVKAFQGELSEAGVDGREVVDQAANYLPHLRTRGSSVFERWAILAAASGKDPR